MVDSSEEGWIIPRRCEAPTMSAVSLPQNPRAPWGCSSPGGPWDWHLSWCDHRPFLEKKGKVTYPCAALSIPHMAISKMEFWYFDICAMLSCNCLNGYMNPKRIDDHPSIDLPSIWSWHWQPLAHIQRWNLEEAGPFPPYAGSVFSESYSVAAFILA